MAELASFIPAPPTSAELDYAALPVIDLALASTPDGKLSLAGEVRKAMADFGFFYVINHGYTLDQTRRIFDIADVPLSHVSNEEKQKYVAQIKEQGSYQGYKPRQYWHIDNGVHDQLENYNINRDITKRTHPEAVRPFLPEIAAFAQHTHERALHPVLRLLALGLDLPEDTLVNMHNFSATGETYVRFMKYYPRSVEEETKTNHVWLKGHTDFGTITILYSQPVAALQILGKDGKWRWVKHIENALIINTGDALQFLSGGRYRATIHRVVQPPPDQQGYTRLGVFYFCMTDDDVRLDPLVPSEDSNEVTDGEAKVNPTMREWRQARTAAYGQSALRTAEGGVEEEEINGIVVKHYN